MDSHTSGQHSLDLARSISDPPGDDGDGLARVAAAVTSLVRAIADEGRAQRRTVALALLLSMLGVALGAWWTVREVRTVTAAARTAISAEVEDVRRLAAEAREAQHDAARLAEAAARSSAVVAEPAP